MIAIVALLVFGPKGLAEARADQSACQGYGLTVFAHVQIAKNLGQTLRAFQPTIKELQQVSQDFKSALDQEVSSRKASFAWVPGVTKSATQIGLDDPKSTSTITGARPDLDSKLTEEMRRASEAAAWGGVAPPAVPLDEGSSLPVPGASAAASEPPAQPRAQAGKLPDLSKLDD